MKILRTLCLPAESTPESSPLKIWSIKPLPVDFFIFLTILHGKNIESLIVPTEFSNFIFRDFELHSLVSGSASSGSLQSVITFPVNIRVNFLDMID